MKYAHIVEYVARTPWAILPAKMEQILSVLAFRASGQEFTDEEIRAQIGETRQAPPQPGNSLAVVSLFGVIAHRMGSLSESSGGCSAERFAAVVRRLEADDLVSTVILDMNTPGGAVAGIPEAAEAVWSLRQKKTVIAVANTAMASAGYWIGSQATEIVAIPSVFDPVIGSIGVLTVHKDISAALEREGVKLDFIFAGKHKVDWMVPGPLSEERRAEAQAMVDATYAKFVKDVARGRGVSPAAVRSGFGEGRALNAADAKAAGLVDRIATMEETIDRAMGRRAARTARSGAAAEASDGSLQAVATERAETVPVDEEGGCPDGYELGEDGACHLVTEPGEAKKARAATDDQMAILAALED